MKMHRLLVMLLVAMLALSLVGCISSDEPAEEGESSEAATEEAAVAVGDVVAAQWTPSSLYLAEVTAVSEDGMVTVKYLDDDSEAEVAEDEYIVIEEKEWAVGDQVLAVWSTAKFYSGTVESVEGDEYIIAWDDGDDPSAVTADKIIAYDAQYATE